MAPEDEAFIGATDTVKPWTIKSISTEARDAAIAAARAENLTVGQWLERRIREWVADGPVAVAGASAISSADVAELVQAAAALAEATGGTVPAPVTRDAFAAIRARLRASRGLPAPAPRAKRLEVDKLETGQTSNQE